MKVAIIGSGGREHIILKKIKENKKISTIFMLPGNAGMEKEAICVDIDINNKEKVKLFALKEKLDFVIVSPDNPLVDGMVDVLEDAGIKCFGPRANAAILEGSKIFSKQFMKKYSIPSASFWTFASSKEAKEFLKTATFPIVIKADGLAFGKGVVIVNTLEDGLKCIEDMMENEVFGVSGKNIVIEEFLEGKEVTILTFCDGKTIVPMISSMDYKKASDGNKGLNTGGMGCISPNPFYTSNHHEYCLKKIIYPTLEALKKENIIFKGCLYFGLIITNDGIKVIEYNCRFGDPEAQTILPLLKSDLFDIMFNVANENLDSMKIEFENANSCCVVMASKGYPKSFKSGFKISYPSDSFICFAGVKKDKNELITSGGRVLCVTSIDKTLEGAREKTYKEIEKINFLNKYYRKDIGELL